MLSQLALGPQSVHRHDPPLKDPRAQQVQGHGHFLGLVIHRLVGQRQAHAMRQRREAMRPRGALFLAASQGLALNGDSLLACLRAAHLPPKPLSPGPALGF